MSKINKLVTNYPVTLTPAEVNNLSQTLSSVRTAGGSGGQQYLAGDSNINVDNEHYRISFTQHAVELLERDIPSAVSQLTDSANYVTNSLLETVSGEINSDINYISAHALTAHQSLDGYLTKTSADTLYQVKGDYLIDDDITGKADKTQLNDYLTTAQYNTDSATFLTAHQDLSNYVTETELETVSGEIVDLIPTNYVTSGNYISGNSQYALTSGGWAEITGGSITGDYVPYTAENLAIGSQVFANDYSFAQGYDNSANWDSVAFGSHATADSRSLAVGENSFAKSHSISIGGGANSHCTSAEGQSIAVGNGVSANNRSIAVGSHSTVADTCALSVGTYCIASGTGSVAIGYKNSAYSVINVGGGQAFGEGLEISGGLAIGCYNETTDAAFVIGNGNEDGSEITFSDSFVIYRDGSVSAKGDISANGVKLGPGGGGSLTLPVNIGSGNALNISTAESGTWGNNADGYLVIGHRSKAGNESFVFGNDSIAQNNSTVLNGGNSALHDSIAQGWKNIAIERSQAFGYNSSASNNSLAAGYSVVATDYSFAGGQAYNSTRGNILASDHSFALGVGSNNEPVIANKYSFAFGYAPSAQNFAFAFGKAIDVEGSDGHAVIGVGGYNEKVPSAAIIVGNGTNNARHNAFVVYNDGNVSSKNYKAEGYTDSNNNYVEASVPKSIPNSGDNSMKVQKMFVCTSDNDIVAHAALANGEGCIFFRVG